MDSKNQEGVLTHDTNRIENRSDQELVCSVQARDETHLKAFEALMMRYEPGIYRTALRMLNNASDAEDITQEVFLKAYRSLPGFRGSASFKTWLYRILHNECMDCFATRKKISQIDESVTEHQIVFVSTSDHSESHLILSDHIQKTLHNLTDQEREMITLRFVSDLSLKDIAQTLNISLSATKMRFYRALERFEREYQNIEAEHT